MTTLAAPAPRKLPVWRTVGACYATVARNLGQLVRISWLWLLIMLPIYAAAHWVAPDLLEGPPPSLRDALVVLPLFVELPFLASIAVAWHRLILRQERVTRAIYLRLDKPVWLYALYSLALWALVYGPLASVLLLRPAPAASSDPDAVIHFVALMFTAFVLMLATNLFVVPRLSLALPAMALGQRFSPWQAWRLTRANTLRLSLATGLCILPAVSLLMLLPFLRWLPDAPWWLGLPWEWWEWTRRAWPSGVALIKQIESSLGYAVFIKSLGYAILTIFHVTLLSLTYRFFFAPREERAAATP